MYVHPWILIFGSFFLIFNFVNMNSIEFKLSLNNRPIIGVLTQELSPRIDGLYPANYTSYIAASYVKYVECAGARVVPIWINKDKSYYKKIMKLINGVLLPGGATYFTNHNGYAAAGAILYELAIELNQQGDYFPIWGTCLGFELLTFISANQMEHRIACSALNLALPLHFKPGFIHSRLFGDAPEDILNILSTQNVTDNYHEFCVTEKNMTKFGLDKTWNILSLNDDVKGLEFVSAIEARNYPFYGVQFHPEKNLFEWKPNKNHPHSVDAIRVTQYFANFFVNEARKSSHTYPDLTSECEDLIYNYPVTYTGDKLAFEQCYFFKK